MAVVSEITPSTPDDESKLRDTAVQHADPTVARQFQSELESVIRASKRLDRLPGLSNLFEGFRVIRSGK